MGDFAAAVKVEEPEGSAFGVTLVEVNNVDLAVGHLDFGEIELGAAVDAEIEVITATVDVEGHVDPIFGAADRFTVFDNEAFTRRNRDDDGRPNDDGSIADGRTDVDQGAGRAHDDRAAGAAEGMADPKANADADVGAESRGEEQNSKDCSDHDEVSY